MLRLQDLTLELGNKDPSVLPGIDQAYAYLAKRGIPYEMIDKLGLMLVRAGPLLERIKGRGGIVDSRIAIIIPHPDKLGGVRDWWSCRLVDTMGALGSRGFASLVQGTRAKMLCPPGERPEAYFPPNIEWNPQDGDYIYFHESAIKAINGAALGYYSIGLNGVWGWCSKRHDCALLPEIRDLPWKEKNLQPVIVFDSNVDSNPDVGRAVQEFAARVETITSRACKHILLPKAPDGADWGFDDFRVTLGDAAARAYLDSAIDAPLLELSEFKRLFLKLQSEVVVVRSLGRIAEQDTGTLMTRGTFCEVNFADYVYKMDDKQINVPKVWLTDSTRMEVEELRYEPGEEPMVPGKFLNLWRGMGLEPEAGDVGPWLELLERQVPDEALRRWIVQWFACPLQSLGVKLNTYLHLYGPPGTGKGAVTAPLLRVYGRNGAIIGKDQIGSTFNSVYALRQFVLIDEIHGGTGPDAAAISNRIKMLATSETIMVNKKGEPEYEVDNHVNFVTNSNYSDSIKLDEGDRRACVVQFGNRDSMIAKEWFRDVYWPWVEGGGGAALYQYLLGVDLAGFDPKGWAPMTKWKEMVTDATRDAMEKWVRDLWDNPESVLPPILQGSKVLTPEQLGMAYYPEDAHKNTPGLRNQLGNRMADVGFKRTELIKVDGKPKRFWIIADRDKQWTNDDVRAAAAASRSGAKF